MIQFSGNPNRIIIPRDEVDLFRAHRPGCNLGSRSYWFEFDPATGDEIDSDVPEHAAGGAAAALCFLAQTFWAEATGFDPAAAEG